MNTQWDYSQLAEAYLKRPNYSDTAIQSILSIMGIDESSTICDVGAGTAHLTLALATSGCQIVSVEPNDNMRKHGQKRTELLRNVEWVKATGEATEQSGNTFDAVTFGSSFNVLDRPKALKEVRRIAKPYGWFAAMWNHRDLQNPIQADIEKIIMSHIPEYNYGVRREDQTSIINESGYFKDVVKLEGSVIHKQSIEEVVQAWRSHATLHRQSPGKFEQIIQDIENYLNSLDAVEIQIPYTTRIWLAQLRD
ncbi:MAG: methyltransferase domain-containing protein [Pseudomonadales bacterium]|uniref:Methyltransferase n=1 Tax=Oleiphilus messinensis TaxID=141451 RepID=A0A1Y0ICH3_9GAMM|nr:methyltransferase domain-containing protein [Oleiphilus messinensis]ARU57165.1 methyltransferase [Oleiphilus messinensis]MCG8610964.1 methyltransferase domain-containing protein [Pseudomonadales bacterium]